MEWSVRIEIEPVQTALAEEQVEIVLEALEHYEGVVSYGSRTVSAHLGLRAPTPVRAVAAGLRIFLDALKPAKIRASKVLDIEVQLTENLDRRLMEPTIPTLVGVAEVARILDVSKQRASELARRPDFPHPIATLASGPIWQKTAILRHMGRWSRKPGRPRKSRVAVEPVKV